MGSPTPFLAFSFIVAIVGALLVVALPAPSYVRMFGNAIVWMVLFGVGLSLYGRSGLWLLAWAPISFYSPEAVVYFACWLRIECL
jgi:hypothetical protein